jgi:hypothetical protein
VWWENILLKICAYVYCVWQFNGEFRSTAVFANTNAKQQRQKSYNRKMLLLLFNYCWLGKAIFFTYPECVLIALSSPHVKRMGRIILCSLFHKEIFFYEDFATCFLIYTFALYVSYSTSFSEFSKIWICCIFL